MGTFSVWHWLIVLIVVLLLFGKGRLPDLMADLAKGIKSFRKGMIDDSDSDETEPVHPVRKKPSRLKKKI